MIPTSIFLLILFSFLPFLHALPQTNDSQNPGEVDKTMRDWYICTRPPQISVLCVLLHPCCKSLGGDEKALGRAISFQKFEKFRSSALGGAVGEMENCHCR